MANLEKEFKKLAGRMADMEKKIKKIEKVVDGNTVATRLQIRHHERESTLRDGLWFGLDKRLKLLEKRK